MSADLTLPAAPPRLEFKPIETRDTAEQAVLVIISSIRHAELDTGDRLPNLPELSESLGIARDNVRRALHALASEGVVEVRPGRHGGTLMRDRSGIPRVLAQILGESLRAEGVWEDLIDARLLLQPAAARLMAERRPAGGLARIDRHLDDMRRHCAEGEYYLAVYDGIEMTCAIAVHCGNRVIAEMLLRVIDRLSVIGVMSRTVLDTTPPVAVGSLDAQERLVAAIHAGDGPAIDRAMHDQLELTKQVVLGMREKR